MRRSSVPATSGGDNGREAATFEDRVHPAVEDVEAAAEFRDCLGRFGSGAQKRPVHVEILDFKLGERPLQTVGIGNRQGVDFRLHHHAVAIKRAHRAKEQRHHPRDQERVQALARFGQRMGTVGHETDVRLGADDPGYGSASIRSICQTDRE
ncbi:hypothetical protein ACTTAI_12540 [Rhodobacter capsulatus]|uniref:hypothetical protein n=1 Tax=Rhodobacter capsulatus TaxID=1061 RepID=UPI004029DE77